MAAVVAAWTWTTGTTQTPPHAPPPTEIGAEEGDGFAQRRREWIERMHAHAPGVDWQALDAATRAAKHAERARLPQAINAAPAGTWRERGARNVAGRVSDVDYDAATDRLTVFAHGGQLWRSLRATPTWQPLNDARQFASHYAQQHFVRLAGTPERWVAADDAQKHLYWSDDQGASWTLATGLSLQNWLETNALVARGTSGTQVYALVIDYNFGTSSWQSRLVVSGDRGATYTDLGFQGAPEKVALIAPGQGSNLVYLLVGSVLKRIETNNTLTTVTTIAGTPAQASSDHVALAAGVASGTPFLFAFFESGGQTKVFRSLDAGATWAARGSVPVTTYFRVAVGTSLHDPNLVFFGAVNLFRSIDGGLNFAPVNDWTEYYGNVAGRLHADISFVRVFPDAQGNDVFFVGTDGGLFQSTDGLASVTNLSLATLRQAQYYDSYTGRNPPYAHSIGAQDQGYQRSARPSSRIASYTQVISGDYAHLTSSDGGATLWMNYPGFTQIDPAPATANATLPAWQFSDGALTNMLFLPPLLADPSNPRIAWLGGGASGAGVNHVVRLTWNGTVQYSGQIAAFEGSYDFGGQVLALAASPQTPAKRYAMAAAGNSARFFRTTTPEAAWTPAASNLPQGQFFYGTTICPDPARANTIYVGGSGYSGPGVYVSTNDGDTFTAMNAGLPSTLVYALAISPDGAHLFAATQVGPYYYDRTASTWVDIGAGAPDTVYWHVDYVPALNTAHFSTFGRGLWAFDLGGGDLIFRDGLE